MPVTPMLIPDLPRVALAEKEDGMGLLLHRPRPLVRLAGGAVPRGAATGRYTGPTTTSPRPTPKNRLRDRERGMTSNATRATALERALEASVTGDSSAVAELYTEDVKGWTPSLSISCAAELAVEVEDRDEAFSDVDLELRPLDVAGDRAAVEWVVRLTHSGPIEIDEMVVEPTGARVTLHGMTVAEFDGDRIRSFRQYWDEVELIEQLALVEREPWSNDPTQRRMQCP
jgi:hypothetical protein